MNFERIDECQRLGKWDEVGEILATHAKVLERGEADVIFICMNKVYGAVQAAVSVPVVHIASPLRR